MRGIWCWRISPSRCRLQNRLQLLRGDTKETHGQNDVHSTSNISICLSTANTHVLIYTHTVGKVVLCLCVGGLFTGNIKRTADPFYSTCNVIEGRQGNVTRKHGTWKQINWMIICQHACLWVDRPYGQFILYGQQLQSRRNRRKIRLN